VKPAMFRGDLPCAVLKAPRRIYQDGWIVAGETRKVSDAVLKTLGDNCSWHFVSE
jgi:hypothetical protein